MSAADGWKEINLPNIRIFPMDVRSLLPDGTTLTDVHTEITDVREVGFHPLAAHGFKRLNISSLVVWSTYGATAIDLAWLTLKQSKMTVSHTSDIKTKNAFVIDPPPKLYGTQTWILVWKVISHFTLHNFLAVSAADGFKTFNT
jgi:hypothetical protein